MKPMITTQLMFQNYHPDMPDHEFMLRELELGKVADELGFDVLWLVEHHFEDYAMCPDNFEALAWLAPQTKQIKLGVGAAILPWNDPLRVIEKAALLDMLSGGRVMLGLGRGLSRVEYRGFRQKMDESRERFDEAAAMVVRGLDAGEIENDGPFYLQPRVEIRPRPYKKFDDRIFSVAMSPETIDAAADLGATMMAFVQMSDEKMLPSLERYRTRLSAKHGRPPNPIVLADLVFCHPDIAYAEEMARKYIARYFFSVLKHYEFAGEHFADTKGYQSYSESARLIREAGFDKAAQDYVDAQVWGTPEKIIERYRQRLEVIGPFTANACCCYGGLPLDESEKSMRLFAKEVMPTLRVMFEEASARAEEARAREPAEHSA
jgi:alkanesulfonate monooxygenase SsuD/methylene tetrahydromethanopterin reductase-like flavin-dependent oxidoreductase (luciferase family)